jgi:integrase
MNAQQMVLPLVETPMRAHDGMVLTSSEVALILSSLDRAALIAAALSFGGGLCWGELGSVRVEELDLRGGRILLRSGGENHEFPIGRDIVDDLREYSLDRACGRKRGEILRLFERETLNRVREELRLTLPGWCRGLAEPFELLRRSGEKARSDWSVRNALDLFEKGPRIVRRGRRGNELKVESYYLWKFRGLCFSEERQSGRGNRKKLHRLPAAA